MTEANCPKCKYDLRSHLGPPMPQMVRCPECGTVSLTYEYRLGYSQRPSTALVWLVVVPLPTLLGFRFVVPMMFVVLAYFWPITIAIVVMHLVAIAMVSGRGNGLTMSAIYIAYALGWDSLCLAAVIIALTVFHF
jgi:hypothetical protein